MIKQFVSPNHAHDRLQTEVGFTAPAATPSFLLWFLFCCLFLICACCLAAITDISNWQAKITVHARSSGTGVVDYG
ncbi:hypothetical protein T11_1754 [Trichinella zimbabwensis]|uniref:Uncharacterized protein n=1 Tax=Trichinella zimbabwensis TaxID=268475 RepID=A0A0V1HGK9_9BILA|nr:hypothetical protein T11_1754 [Trichinella zimbabwensis]